MSLTPVSVQPVMEEGGAVLNIDPWAGERVEGKTPSNSKGLRRRIRELIGCSVVPAVTFPLESQEIFDRTRTLVQSHLEEYVDAIRVNSKDGTVLDGMILRFGSEEGRWLIYHCGNGSAYEQTLLPMAKLAHQLGINILLYNYRGVSRSEGRPVCAEDLVQDGESVLRYLLLERGIAPEKVLLLGWSLGGAVATSVAARYPGVALINDRSFDSLPRLARDLFQRQAKVLRRQGLKKRIYAALLRQLGPLAQFSLRHNQWDFYSLANWQEVKGKKLIIFHERDEMMGTKESLFHRVVEVTGEVPTHVRLSEFFHLWKPGPHWRPQLVLAESQLPGQDRIPIRAHEVPVEAELGEDWYRLLEGMF